MVRIAIESAVRDYLLNGPLEVRGHFLDHDDVLIDLETLNDVFLELMSELTEQSKEVAGL